MRDDKSTEGFIPAGLIAGDLRGTAVGSLTIAGTVERSEIRVEQLVVVDSGDIANGSVEAESVMIEGRASGMTFRAARLTAGSSARISDCIIEMTNPTGCAIDESAHFEGDVQIVVTRPNRSSETEPTSKAYGSDKKQEASSSSSSNASSDNAFAQKDHSSDERQTTGDTKKGSGVSKGSSSKGFDSEIDDAESDIDIPLGD